MLRTVETITEETKPLSTHCSSRSGYCRVSEVLAFEQPYAMMQKIESYNGATTAVQDRVRTALRDTHCTRARRDGPLVETVTIKLRGIRR